MQLGYVLDTNVGSHDAAIPQPKDAAAVIERLIIEAQAAEAAGFDSVVVPERHMRGECVMPDPLTLLTVLARETHRVRLGTAATVLTLHNPMEFAERVALIDLLSGGRVFVTVARGFNTDYWRMMGVSQDQVTRRFLESVEVVKKAWANGRFSFNGKLLRFDDVFISPPPLQAPRPPIWAGGHSLPAIKRAGEIADGWLGGFFPLDRAAWLIAVAEYRHQAEKARNPSTVALTRVAFVASDGQRARDLIEPHVLRELAYYHGRAMLQPYYALRNPTEQLVRQNLVVGSPDECVAALSTYETDLGVDYIMLRFRTPTGPTITEAIEAVRLFGREVIPKVRVPPRGHN
jgi:alkanesulfonate monooxygenase SsuD/methylene tetrahydromethanopterin reductase-like flavin-dependent oxidoreductase (luciferase family)